MTEVFETIASLRLRLETAGSIAFVPTMGALHDGHLALVARAADVAETVVVSIFVNPLQFGAGEDLDRYPRDLESDLAKLPDDVLVFAPPAGELYPYGASETLVTAGGIGARFEGASRPGHFDGMLTVVAKLLNIVRPDVVVFGQKDAQQVFLVRRMVRDLNVPVVVDVVETVRDADGLALSSRNRYLDADQHRAALALSRALAAAAASGESRAAALAAARSVLEAEPAVDVDYVELVDPATFLPVADDHRGPTTAIVAARVGTTRLIDNRQVTLAPAE
ncbi:pantoate--beta-alanine ligase [Cryobacterium mesophilum]|uniref:Pantothenate synthetase n=1 Tax=Terrimesophilobacter mesophilus TaxID=433647 RepID=A0A4R8VDY9_9MICO|nr:pantoate--beta-alanine ligase [Terrimesophilobacter mesophilus]MBB5633322.1 pantoate--beta-alanine ligase [Terrimesophilobacter mesophilus]TFB80057.1 pantoate--beta-alanine ligase [Terrimesophilobacter mesophilus]